MSKKRFYIRSKKTRYYHETYSKTCKTFIQHCTINHDATSVRLLKTTNNFHVVSEFLL